MYKKKILFLLALLPAVCLSLAGQSVSEIKRSKDYYWGEGSGRSSKMAENEALARLLRMISVNVSAGDFLKRSTAKACTASGQRAYCAHTPRPRSTTRSVSSGKKRD